MLKKIDFQQAVEALLSGQLVIYPTETAWAVGADATDVLAAAALFALKGRPDGKGLPVIIPAEFDPFTLVEDVPNYRALLTKYWPGPLNIIAPRRSTCPLAGACATGATQSLRRSSHPVASALATAVGRPLTATSANISGQPSCYTWADLKTNFAHTPQEVLVLDHPDLAPTPASTTVELTADGQLTVIRQGALIIDYEFS